MLFDADIIRAFYMQYPQRVNQIRQKMSRPLTYAEKVLYSHLYHEAIPASINRGTDYAMFRPDRVAMQDATAQMALLQFMNAGKNRSAVPTTIHCDHLIQAYEGVGKDLPTALKANGEVYDFLRSVAQRYGLGFWKPGAGIIHQVVLENYAFPGGMMIGTDSHTPNAGGLSMIAIGVGGADAVDVMSGMEWELKVPRLIGVRLSGKLNGWASPKDIILKLAGILTVKGGTNAILEYFGEGVSSLSTTGKATICNMGAEVGATTSIFPYDEKAADYLKATGRKDVAAWADTVRKDLKADDEVLASPEKYFDQVIDIDLSILEPYLNGPFTPDAATPLGDFANYITQNGYPQTMEVGLIGSCTNSSYQDLARASSVLKHALENGLKLKARLIINPGSDKVCDTAERDGIMNIFRQAGALIMTNACGPCIGQWKRVTDDPLKRNSIVTSFNRNFAKRADGNPNTHAFVASPEIVVALALAGDMCFNPLADTLINSNGERISLLPPSGDELPANGFIMDNKGPLPPADSTETPTEVTINPNSERIQRLLPFTAWDGKDLLNLPLLIKVKGKCTTDHISMAGPWLRFRGHLENISENLLMGAVNAFTEHTNEAWNPYKQTYEPVSAVAKCYKSKGVGSVIVAEENYGEGSSREHAAMEPRFLNVRAVIAKSFARIHETNLKKQGVLALTFADKSDYEKIGEKDSLSILGLSGMQPGQPLYVKIRHDENGTEETIKVSHSYNEQQIEWFKAGSALNVVCNGKN